MVRLAITFRDNGRLRSLAVTADYFSLSENGTLTYGYSLPMPDGSFDIGHFDVPGVVAFSAR